MAIVSVARLNVLVNIGTFTYKSVSSPCSAGEDQGYWVCLTHEAVIKEGSRHLRKGTHRLVWVCEACGNPERRDYGS